MIKTSQFAVFILLTIFLSCRKGKVTERTAILNETIKLTEIKYRIVDSLEKNNYLRYQTIKSAEQLQEGSFIFKELIPNTETAVKIAFIYLSQVYGEKTIIDEFPLNVDSIGENWIITGTLHSEKGGTAHIELKKTTGTVIDLYHEK